jgi:hypothetical protein
MSEGQKRQILVENGLNQYLEVKPEEVVTETSAVPEEVAPGVSGGVSFESMNEQKEALAEAKQEVERVERELNPEEQDRVDAETGKNLQPTGQNKVKFFGYQPSPNLVNDNDEVSENGNVADGSTWVATLLKKLFAVFS